jgi:membrane protein implicated in regulation of membrane protease activity
MAMHYIWWVIALGLIGAEVLVPGFFLLWIGIAAGAMGILTWLMPDLAALPQAVIFAALAFASCFSYWRWLRGPYPSDPDNVHLNRRGEQHIGKRYVLETAIEQGRGKARVGDSQWLVEGPDLPVGATVEVVAVDGATLRVTPA